MMSLPRWVILHVPHDATCIPPEVRGQFVLDDGALSQEIIAMTDHCTLDLFATGVPTDQVVRAPVSRLVVDVERFEDDALEPMSALGMGVVYTSTHDLKVLRRPISEEQRQALIATWYRPHHDALALATGRALQEFGRALVIDCHSFPSRPLRYELNQRQQRPQICIGTDAFHTPPALAAALVSAFDGAGFHVALNTPFSGALVPSQYFGHDSRVAAAMIEVRRDLYLDEATGVQRGNFVSIARTIRECLSVALQALAK